MKKISTILIFSVFSICIYAQKYQFGYSFGYGSYNLDELKKFHKDLTAKIPINNLKVLESFPDYFFHSLEAGIQLSKDFELGLSWSYLYTGARSQVSDYSGIYSLDMQLNDNNFGLQLKYYFLSNLTSNKLMPFLQLKAGFAFSTLKMVELASVYDADTVSNSYTYKNHNPFIEPGAGINFKIIPHISLIFYAGYEFDFARELHEKDDDTKFIYNSSGDKLKLDWSGIRLRAGINFNF